MYNAIAPSADRVDDESTQIPAWTMSLDRQFCIRRIAFSLRLLETFFIIVRVELFNLFAIQRVLILWIEKTRGRKKGSISDTPSDTHAKNNILAVWNNIISISSQFVRQTYRERINAPGKSADDDALNNEKCLDGGQAACEELLRRLGNLIFVPRNGSNFHRCRICAFQNYRGIFHNY